MATTYEGTTGRIVGITLGGGSSVVAVGVFLLVAVPNGLLPPLLEEMILGIAPWLGSVGSEADAPGLAGIAMISIFCVMLLLPGLWTLHGALFESNYSITLTKSKKNE